MISRMDREKANMNKKRLDYLDMTKGIGIILVVIGHSTFAGDHLLTWIASFHMPLFFIVTGMLLQHTQEEKIRMSIIVRKKTKSIMLPYISFSIIYLAMDMGLLLLHLGNKTLLDFYYAIISTFTCYGISTLWFLPALFIGEISFLFIRKRYSHIITILIGFMLALIVGLTYPIFDARYSLYKTTYSLILGYLLICLYRGAVAYLFIAMGYYVKRYVVEKEKMQMKEISLGLILLLTGAAFAFTNGRVDLHSVVLKNSVYFYISAFAGTMGVILISKNIMLLKALQYAGRNSLIIMATHLDFRIMITAIRSASFVHAYLMPIPLYVRYVIMAIVVVVLEYIIIYIMNHFFYFLIGKNKPLNRKKFKVVK